MKVIAITPINTLPNLPHTNSEISKTNNTSTVNNTNLVTPSALYNKIQFTGKVPTKPMPELIEYMEKTVQPFLDNLEPTYKKVYKLSIDMKDEVRLFVPKTVDFKPAEFKEAKRLRLDELNENIQEFSYLLRKSNPENKIFSTEQTHQYALDLLETGMFQVPAFVQKPYEAYVKMINDTNNGLKNITLQKLYPDVANKKQDIRQVATEAGTGIGFYFNIRDLNNIFHNLLKNGKLDITSANRLVNDAKRSINLHKECLPEIEKSISDVEQMSKTGMFIEYDYEMLHNVPKRAQQVISRNAKKFNDIASKTELDTHETRMLDAIIARQKELIEDLWYKIEADKKAHFESLAKEKTEFKTGSAVQANSSNTRFDDNLPF